MSTSAMFRLYNRGGAEPISFVSQQALIDWAPEGKRLADAVAKAEFFDWIHEAEPGDVFYLTVYDEVVRLAGELDRPIDHQSKLHLGKIISHLREAEPGNEEDLIDARGVLKATVEMLRKMRASSKKGRGGWHDPSRCAVDFLMAQLLEHLPKGDMVDVMNFAMMLWNRSLSVEVSSQEFRESMGEMLNAMARGLLNDEYNSMEDVYRQASEQLKAEAYGQLGLPSNPTLGDLARAEIIFGEHLTNLLQQVVQATKASKHQLQIELSVNGYEHRFESVTARFLLTHQVEATP